MSQTSKIKLMVSTVMLAGLATQAFAGPTPTFKVDTTIFEGAGAHNFSANFLSGSASSILDVDPVAKTINGHGYTIFGQFSNSAGPLFGFQTGLGNGYNLWGEYSYTTSYSNGPFGGPQSNYTITSLSFTLWGEKLNGSDSTFVSADNSGSAAASDLTATVVHSADTIELGVGTLANGVAAINNNLGTSFNSNLNFSLTNPAGTGFFYDPKPFYQLAFSSFTNTSNGFVVNPANGRVAINSASGGADFAQVPEPAVLALVALGLVAAGLRTRKSKQE